MNQEIENINKQLEEIIKKNLPMKYDIGEENYDLKDRHLEYNEAIDDIDTSLIADEVLKVVVGNERKWIEDNWINFYESSKPLADFKKELLRKLNLLSPNKENEIIHKSCGTKSSKGEYEDGTVDYLCHNCDVTFLDNDEQTIIS